MFRLLKTVIAVGFFGAPALAADGVTEAAGICLNEEHTDYETKVCHAFRYGMLYQMRQVPLHRGFSHAFTSKPLPLPGQQFLPSTSDGTEASPNCCEHILVVPPQKGALGGQVVQ